MLRHADGFDHWGTTANARSFYGWHEFANVSVNENNPRTGDWAIELPHGNNNAFWTNAGLARRIICGAALYVGSPITFSRQGFFFNPGGNTISVYITTSNKIQIIKGSNTLIAESAPNVWVPGAYNYIEFDIFTDDTNGTAEVRVNGNPTPVISATGLALYSADIDVVGFTGNQSDTAFIEIDMFVDDWYICDGSGAYNNDFLGDIRCRTRFPTGNGPSQDWTPHNAPAWSELDLVPPDVANHFVTSSAINDVSNFTLTQLPTNTAYGAGLVMFSNVNKSDAGACGVTPQISSNGVVANGTPISPGTGTAFYRSIFEVDPNTGIPFLLPALQLVLGQEERTA